MLDKGIGLVLANPIFLDMKSIFLELEDCMSKLIDIGYYDIV